MALGGTFSGGITIDGAKLAAFVREPGGGTVRLLLKIAEEVKDEAQMLVGYDDGPDRNGARPHLRDTIVKRIVDGGTRPIVEVGSESPIALFHHEGTAPHIIRPVRAPKLVFFSKKAGRVIVTSEVHHPGTKPNPFLTDALRSVMRRHR